jgi:hypothetical protein
MKNNEISWIALERRMAIKLLLCKADETLLDFFKSGIS